MIFGIVTPILGIYGSVVPFPSWPQNLGVFIGLGVVALSLTWTLANRFVFPARLGKASEPHPWEAEELEASEEVSAPVS